MYGYHGAKNILPVLGKLHGHHWHDGRGVEYLFVFTEKIQGITIVPGGIVLRVQQPEFSERIIHHLVDLCLGIFAFLRGIT